MIFEADYTVVKKALTTIQNLLTPTEANKNESRMVQLHVKGEQVYISHQGKKGSQLEYHLNLMGANPIFDGSVLVDFQELNSAIKSFSKSSGTLLFERDGNEIRIDDGVYEPELILLPENSDVEREFFLKPPFEKVKVPTEWFSHRLELARLNTKATFLPATSEIALLSYPQSIQIRSFNLSNIYESTLTLESPSPIKNEIFLLDKNAASRMAKLLKTTRAKTISLYWTSKELFVYTSDFVFRFAGVQEPDSEELFKALPTAEMTQGVARRILSLSELQGSIERCNTESFHLIPIGNQISILTELPEDEVPEKTLSYSIKTLKKVLSKWMPTAELIVGTKENCHALTLSHHDQQTEDWFILMPCE